MSSDVRDTVLEYFPTKTDPFLFTIVTNSYY